jgi:hypothetical protein
MRQEEMRSMFWLKCCPKCNKGDLFEGKDLYGRYVSCLQCGYYLTEAEEVVLRETSCCKCIAHDKKDGLRELVVGSVG